MNRYYLFTAAVFGFLGVAIGAFGAHGLENILTPDKMETFRTGVLYHLVHAVVLLALALKGDKRLIPGFLFIALGIILFSFSLYFYTTTGIKALAMITPAGGFSFLTGWGIIALRALKNH